MSSLPTSFGDDRVEAGARGRLRLLCPFPKGWRARSERTRLRPEHPGTAVRWDGVFFEVVRARRLAGGGVVYELQPWDEQHAMRTVAVYDEASERKRIEERRDLMSRHRRYRLVLLLAPLAGCLPAADQERLELELGLSATHLTLASALPLLLFGTLSVVSLFTTFLAGTPLLPIPLALFGDYLFAESIVRLGVALSQGRPAGSFPAVLAWEAGKQLWSVLRGRRIPGWRKDPPGGRTG